MKSFFSKENKIYIEIKNNISLRAHPGKILEVSLCLKDKGNKHADLKKFGSLEPINNFFGELEEDLDKKFKKYNINFYIGGEEIDIGKHDKGTFSSKEANFMNDFRCVIIDQSYKKKKSLFNW